MGQPPWWTLEDPHVVIEDEALQFLDFSLLEHRSLLRSQRPLIHSILLLLELLLFGELLVFSLVLCTCELVVSTVHSKFFACVAIELEDGCSCPSVPS